MVILKCSKIIDRKIGFVSIVDVSVRQYETQSRIVYIGQGSQIIQIPEENLDEFFEFVKEARSLELDREHKGWLK